jgi:L-threonylcarbamoyladenylate synthase
MPAHPIAKALIERAGIPLAAPSANLFTHVSPTTAEHVRESLGERIEMILDGGPCAVGIESTVVSLAGERTLLLRPGMISAKQLEDVIGPIGHTAIIGGAAHPAPGMHHRHYAPRTALHVLNQAEDAPTGRGRVIEMPATPGAYAATLYAVLRKADTEGWDWIAVRTPPDTEEWAAIRDRLKRASVASDTR